MSAAATRRLPTWPDPATREWQVKAPTRLFKAQNSDDFGQISREFGPGGNPINPRFERRCCTRSSFHLLPGYRQSRSEHVGVQRIPQVRRTCTYCPCPREEGDRLEHTAPRSPSGFRSCVRQRLAQCGDPGHDETWCARPSRGGIC